jgi:hypothetical protein
MYVSVYVCMYTCMYVSVYASMCVSVSVSLCVCVRGYMAHTGHGHGLQVGGIEDADPEQQAASHEQHPPVRERRPWRCSLTHAQRERESERVSW